MNCLSGSPHRTCSGTDGEYDFGVSAIKIERAAQERRLRAMAEAIASYETEFGTIVRDELDAQARLDRTAARGPRGPRSRGAKPPRRRNVGDITARLRQIR